ncbi:MAG: FHA domain-containing protein [Acidobacteria bacterium]|nr:FHA domain-containing protein [Acidobacteriota bacterium]
MKPSNTKADPSGAAPKTGSDASVADELRAIDTSVLDQLLEMRQEEVRIEEYRQRADTMKEAVDPLVWQRVVTDYKSRLAALEAQARPLKAQARKEYAKLRVLLDRITAEQKAAQVSKAELDFRHAVGELDDAALAERLEGPVGIIARCEEELTSVGALKTRFVEAFGAEIELEEPAAAALPPAAVPASSSAASSTPAVASKPAPPTPAAPAVVESPDATTFVVVEELLAEATMIGASVNVTQPLPSSAGTTAPDPAATMLHTPAAAPGEADDHTFLLPAAALLIGPDEPSPQEYRLAAVNYLGRSDDSHLQIARPGVSRRHAVIMAASGGFVIQDLGSQNGVFVNGERIAEHALKDGDQVVIGDRTMVYRTPWPQSRRADSRTRATKA